MLVTGTLTGFTLAWSIVSRSVQCLFDVGR